MRANRIDIVNLLLEHGASTNLLDDFDKTAMHYAISMGNKEIFEVRKRIKRGERDKQVNI